MSWNTVLKYPEFPWNFHTTLWNWFQFLNIVGFFYSVIAMPLVFWHRSHIFIILFLHLSTLEVTNYCDTLENMFFLLLPVCAQPQMFVVISTRGKNPCNHHQLPLIPAVWLYLGLTIAAVIFNNNINVPRMEPVRLILDVQSMSEWLVWSIGGQKVNTRT